MECFTKAGFPEGVVNFITGKGSIIGQGLIDHPLLNAITFTGSESVGQSVAKSASARGIKYQLEMGGKNPVIVTKDANIDQAVEAVISGGFRSQPKCTAQVAVVESSVMMNSNKTGRSSSEITAGTYFWYI
jgi:aldehyde dehydrogenase (NAD+)